MDRPKSKFVRKSFKVVAIILDTGFKFLDVYGYEERRHNYRVFRHECAKKKLIASIKALRNTDFMKYGIERNTPEELSKSHPIDCVCKACQKMKESM